MSYEPTIWKKGDKVTSTKLNKIENGIQGNDTEISNLKEDLNNIASTETSANLFDPSKIEEKSYFNYSNGNLVSNNSFFAEYVPVTTGYYTFIIDIAFFGDSGKRIPFFDNEKNYLGYVAGTYGTITDNEAAPVTIEITNANTAFIGVSQLNKFLQTMMVVKGQEYPSEYIPYIEPTFFLNEDFALTPKMVDEVNGLSGIIGKTAIFDGDSICKGTINGTTPEETNGWAGYIGTANDMTYHNYAVSGGVITSASNQLVSDKHSVVDNIDTMYANYPNADIVIFEGGTNDADLLGNAIADPTVLGTYTDLDFSGSYDATTFTGALETIFYKATQYWVGKKIGFIVAQKMGYSTTGFDKNHTNRRAYFERAIDICKKWGIPYLNLWDDCYLNPNNPSCYNRNQTKDENITAGRLYTDGQHLTKKGYQYISPIIEDWMKSL